MSDNDVLMIDTILPALKANSQKQAFQVIAEHVAQITGQDQKSLLIRLGARERQSTSGIGGGVAIPHLTLRNLEKPYVLFARLSQMIDYNALDDEPVDLVCLLLSPKSEGPYHLRRLAYISRLLRDQDLCSCLRGADNVDALHALLFDFAARKLAA